MPEQGWEGGPGCGADVQPQKQSRTRCAAGAPREPLPSPPVALKVPQSRNRSHPFISWHRKLLCVTWRLSAADPSLTPAGTLIPIISAGTGDFPRTGAARVASFRSHQQPPHSSAVISPLPELNSCSRACLVKWASRQWFQQFTFHCLNDNNLTVRALQKPGFLWMPPASAGSSTRAQ